MSGGTTDTSAAGSVISLPKGGGAIAGLGEKFSPDLCTGTGNFSVPLMLPPGRSGVQPQLGLAYSTGNGNGIFGLGWALSLPGVTRKTSRGVPRYFDDGPPNLESTDTDNTDVFLLSGAEDLVPITGTGHVRRGYRPRTEGLFARIEHIRGDSGDYWEVRSKDGLLSRYGTRRPPGATGDWGDPAATRDPERSRRIFAWKITETSDAFGNLIRYDYTRDQGRQRGHGWDQPLISRISYADFGVRADPSFLVSVEFDYEERPDPFSDYRAGFEIRTSLRCRAIRVATHPVDGSTRTLREYRFAYEQAPFNGCSVLARVDAVGVDDQGGQPEYEQLPPLRLGYSAFQPQRRRFRTLSGPSLPTVPLSDPTVALVDLRGIGLPDVVELGAVRRSWANHGEGRFDLPRAMAEAPPHALGDPGVTFLDANGDGRADLLVTSGTAAGYFPTTFRGAWSSRSFQPYREWPSIDFDDPSVKLVDLDGDGLTDVVRSGAVMECWFNDPDPRRAWQRTATSRPVDLDGAPGPDLADPQVRLADMTGDGLPDIVLVRDGSVAYWPNLGHGRWGTVVHMRHAPRLPHPYDPRRLLLGDLDGDGLADLAYVEPGRVRLWGNRAGNAWTEQPVIVAGTPDVVDLDTVQLVDLHGTGMAGLLWSRPADVSGRPHLRFLDLTGGVKPYLLDTVDNSMGALTRVDYRPSTQDFLRDQAHPATRWRTTLPFPVHVVARVVVSDAISHGTLATEYRYSHGYWDGVEREFRGFARVEQLDTETFAGPGEPAAHYSPPTLTKTWFHVGPVAAVEAGDWVELDLTHEHWAGDPAQLLRPPDMLGMLAGLPRGGRRDALRALRGQVLRTELYALDGTERQGRPYTVTEALSGVAERFPPSEGELDRPRIFFAFSLANRTTQWERGVQPMTQYAFLRGYDGYGFPTQQLAVAVPRGRDPSRPDAAAAAPYLATYTTTAYARRDDETAYLVDRVARATNYEVGNDGQSSVFDLSDAVFAGSTSLRLIGHTRTYYDGDCHVGLPLGEVGEHGLPMRVESLAFSDGFLDELFDPADPKSVSPRPVYLDPAAAGREAGPAWTTEYPEEFQALLPALAGYRHYADGDVPGSPAGFYVVEGSHCYDVHDPARDARGLLVATRDPLGAESRIDYDVHDLLPVAATDPAGLVVTAENDYRVLQPRAVTDPNGTTTIVTVSPAGLLTERYVRGESGEGDQDAPSVRMAYDLGAFARSGQPLSVRTERRVHHDTTAPAESPDEVIVSVEFSDGFGRPLQTRAQAQDTLFGDPTFGAGVIGADQLEAVGATVGRTRAPNDPANVVVSGWQVYDNKGRVVAKYEPFFATGWEFADPVERELGRKVVLFYDPRGRVVRTVYPDGSEDRVVFGVPVDLTDPDIYEPSPWESFRYDANDNAGRTHPQEAAAYQGHWNTPASIEVDALGRTVVAVARNADDDHPDGYRTRTAYDIQGNLVAITDALGRGAFGYRFDLAKRRWRMDSIDAGRRDTVPDALGNPVEGRDGKGALTLRACDRLHRPTRLWARDAATGPMTLRQRVEYGDGGDPDQPAAERAAARAHNLLGVAVAHYDEAGVVRVTEVDFKGNAVETSRRLIADAPLLAVYEQAAGNGWQMAPFRVDWQPGSGETRADQETSLLEPTAYQTTTSYDALDRVTRQLLPVDVEGRRRALCPTYNRAGALEAVRLDDTDYVRHIAYDAKGQRTLIAYGNDVLSRYAYDADAFRLVRLRSERYISTDPVTFSPAGEVLQDYGYAYDLVGNILAIHDRTPGSGISQNPAAFEATDRRLGNLLVTGNALDRRFTYDPIYRLQSATGRECDAPPDGPPWLDLPRCTDLTRTRYYTETYTYDAMSSMLTLTHASAGGFTREFAVETDTNRLVSMRTGGNTYAYDFDDNGNMGAEGATRHFTWNHADQLTGFATATHGAEPSVHAQYLYDAGGQRVKKLVRQQGGRVEVTHYVGGLIEHHRWGSPSHDAQNTVVHVMDDRQRIALIRVGAPHPDDRGPAVQFHLADHLGNGTVVVDTAGAVTNREEYTPYGESSFGSFARKRYRFTGQERDEESGLLSCGARWYGCWLVRWLSCDPLGPVATPSLYEYCRCNPMAFMDMDGRDPVSGVKTEWEQQGFILTVTQTLSREGEHSRLSSTIDAATDKMISQRLFRRNDYFSKEWVDVTAEAAREGALSVAWRMPDTRTDEEMARHVRGPGLLYGMFPRYLNFYLKDQTLSVKNPHTRMLARATQEAARAVDKVTYDLAEFAVLEAMTSAPGAILAKHLSNMFARRIGAIISLSTDAPNAVASTTRVGRWMSEAEHNAMLATNKVQQGGGGTTYVAHPSDIHSFARQAQRGSRYVEFDVPSSSLFPGGKEGWSQIPGPGSMRSKLILRQGGQALDMPNAGNIVWVGSKP